MGNSIHSCPCHCTCSDKSTQHPITLLEDMKLWDLYWCRLRLQQEEYFKNHGIRCGLKCSVFEGSDKKDLGPCEASITKLRNTASDEELDKNAIHLCCIQREESQCEDEFCSGNPYPSRKKDYLKAISNCGRYAAKQTPEKVIPATEMQRKQYWMKYFPPLSLVRLQNDAPEKMVQEALENPCSCRHVKHELPTCQQISDLVQCPNMNFQDCATCNLSAPTKQLNIQCPRVSFDPLLSPTTHICSEQMTSETPKVQIRTMHVHQPMHHQPSYSPPVPVTQYRGQWTENGPQYGIPMMPQQQQITPTNWPQVHMQSPPCPQINFLEILHVGQVTPINVSVNIYSNNIMTAEVKGFFHQPFVRSTISKRWSIPPGVPAENITCYYGNENLVIVTLPPPEQFYRILHFPTAQCLGPPRRISYPYPYT